MSGVRFVKGHGTGNDFVLLPDLDGELELTPARVRALCDRRRGLGADGVLRVVRTSAGWDLGQPVPDPKWFMDYRNADGSVARMCGNGARVFAHYLAVTGLVARGGTVAVATRAGVRSVWWEPDGQLTVDMGPVRVGGPSVATVAGRPYPGVAVDVGNPHLVCLTDTPLDEIDLSVPPGVDRELFGQGVNVEFVTPVADGVVSMRVHERGVGETSSCGTGTVAAAAVVVSAGVVSPGVVSPGVVSPGTYSTGVLSTPTPCGLGGQLVVRAPGGQVRVGLAGPPDALGATLTGPAELVASGELDLRWWQALGEPPPGEIDRTATTVSVTMAAK